MSNKQNIQEKLISMGFQKNYIHRTLKVYEKNWGKQYNIEVIAEIIVRLQDKDRAKKQRNTDNKCNEIEIDEPITAPLNNSNMPPFTLHMTLDQAQKLRIHDKIDHRDQVGRFVYATVLEKQGTNLKIHYVGWNQKWDTWSDFSLEIHRFAFAGSISKRSAHRFKHLKKGEYIDINPTQKHPGWKCGKIRRFDKKSGQVQVVYESLDKTFLYWAHLDNTLEIAEFASRSGRTHDTQIQIIARLQDKDRAKKQRSWSKKRSLNVYPSEIEPPTKKPKLNINLLQVRSNLFLNNSDHKQFEQIFESVDNSQLANKLQVAHLINKQIAEYATGTFVECYNSKCSNQISILFQDRKIYNNNHKNANKLGYKWDVYFGKYYCSKCLDKANSCGCCESLYFEPDCVKCNECKSIIPGCEKCDCEDCCGLKCYDCDYISCVNCGATSKCTECGYEYCNECNVMSNVDYADVLCAECDSILSEMFHDVYGF